MKINSDFLPKIKRMETIFEGTGAKASTTGAYVSTATTKNPKNYDILIVSFTNIGDIVERINVLFTPKTGNTGSIIFFGATTEYNAYVAFTVTNTGVSHMVRQTRGWQPNVLYIQKIQGIKLNDE